MNSRLPVNIAATVVLAAGIAVAMNQLSGRDSAAAPNAAVSAVQSPPGVNPARWLPLGPATGLALHPESQATSPDVVLSGDLWAFVNGHWHIVRLPAMPPPASFGTVPAALVVSVRPSTTHS